MNMNLKFKAVTAEDIAKIIPFFAEYIPQEIQTFNVLGAGG